MTLTSHAAAMDLVVEFPGNGWSQGSVLAQSLNSSWVHRLKKARRQSLLKGMCHKVIRASNNMAIGIEYKTIDDNEPTILTSNTEQTGMNPHRARNVI